jgi:hypothetical protein
MLVVLNDPQHRGFSLRIVQLIRESARFLCAGAPVLWTCNLMTPEQEIRSGM